MAQNGDKLKLGKGSAFVKSRMMRLPQEEETWEADFCALPKPMMQSATHYWGMVVTQPDGFVLADLHVEGKPSVNDLATLLANAVRRPLTESAHRPARILLRGHRQWQELFPHLKELGIEVVVQKKLLKVQAAYKDYLLHLKKARSAEKTKPSTEQANVEKLFPATARWVSGYGHIEIGDQEGFGFVVMALDYGGVVFEDDRASTLAEAMVALEQGLGEWFKEEGIE